MSNSSLFNQNLKPKIIDFVENNPDYRKKAGETIKKLYHYNVDYVPLVNKIYRNKKLFGTLQLLQYALFIVLLYWYNPFRVTNKYPMTAAVMTLTLSFIYVMLFYFLREKVDIEKAVNADTIAPTEWQFVKQLLSTIGFFMLSIFLMKGAIWVIRRTNSIYLFQMIISLLFLIGILGIIYLILAPWLEKSKDAKKPTLTSLLYKIIMYVPCLLLLALDYLKNQFNITTKTVWIVIGLEICLIVLYLLVPILYGKMMTSNGVQLLKEPIPLNYEQTLGSFEQLYVEAPQKSPDKKKTVLYNAQGIDVTVKRQFQYDYALSFWFYINPQGTNTNVSYTQYTPLLSYANKPRVEYNAKLNSLRVMTETGKDEEVKDKDKDVVNDKDKDVVKDKRKVPPTPVLSYQDANVLVEIFETKEILYQKWNHMVINYSNGTMDIFLNGELVGSKGGISPFMSFENITAGHNKGIYGGLCNVMFYNNPMSVFAIKTMYKMLRNQTGFPI